MSHRTTCVGLCGLYITRKTLNHGQNIILKGLLQLQQSFPLHVEMTKWDLDICAMQEVSELEATTDP